MGISPTKSTLIVSGHDQTGILETSKPKDDIGLVPTVVYFNEMQMVLTSLQAYKLKHCYNKLNGREYQSWLCC